MQIYAQFGKEYEHLQKVIAGLNEAQDKNFVLCEIDQIRIGDGIALVTLSGLSSISWRSMLDFLANNGYPDADITQTTHTAYQDEILLSYQFPRPSVRRSAGSGCTRCVFATTSRACKTVLSSVLMLLLLFAVGVFGVDVLYHGKKSSDALVDTSGFVSELLHGMGSSVVHGFRGTGVPVDTLDDAYTFYKSSVSARSVGGHANDL